MDLSALGCTLPPGLADAEKDIGDQFRATALSITNLYKSGLSHAKTAYHSGYSACLADVLSTVQSSIGAGQDVAQTLSRLMDWADAREAAMVEFASEEPEDPHSSTSLMNSKRVAPLIKQHLNQTLLREDNTPTASSSRVNVVPPIGTASSPLQPQLTRRISRSPLRTRQDTLMLSTPTFNPVLPNNLPHPPSHSLPNQESIGSQDTGSVGTGRKRNNMDIGMISPDRELAAIATPRGHKHKRRKELIKDENGGAGAGAGEERESARKRNKRGGSGHGGHGNGRGGGAVV